MLVSKTKDDIRSQFRSLSTTEDLAAMLEVSIDTLRWHAVRSDIAERYRSFKIPKKSGGERTILAPSPGLKLLQRKINYVLQMLYQPRGATCGFVLDRSTKQNAMPHHGNRWVFNIDLEDFFPSINYGRVRGLLLRNL